MANQISATTDGVANAVQEIARTISATKDAVTNINETVEGVRDITNGAQTCVTSNEVVFDAMSSLSAISEENAASSAAH